MSNLNLNNVPVKSIKKFYTKKGFTEEIREDNGDIGMSKNCQTSFRTFPSKHRCCPKIDVAFEWVLFYHKCGHFEQSGVIWVAQWEPLDLPM